VSLNACRGLHTFRWWCATSPSSPGRLPVREAVPELSAAVTAEAAQVSELGEPLAVIAAVSSASVGETRDGPA